MPDEGSPSNPVNIGPFAQIVGVTWDRGPKTYLANNFVWQAIYEPLADFVVRAPSGSDTISITGVTRIDVNVTGLDSTTTLLFANYGAGESASVVTSGPGGHGLNYDVTGTPTGVNPADLPPGITFSAFFGHRALFLGSYAPGDALVSLYFKDPTYKYSPTTFGGFGGTAIAVNGTVIEGVIPT